MKQLATLSLLLVWQALSALASYNLSPYDSGTPIGWASVNGSTTGSNDVNPIVVTTLDEFTSALKTAYNNTKNNGSAQITIYVKGTIETDKYIYVQDTKNLTIYGLPGSALVNNNRDEKAKTGIMLIKRCENLIMRNMTFKSAGAYDIDGNDNLTLQSSNHVWIDHCDFQDGVDGNFDCNNQATNVSVTWCRFRYLIAPKSGGSGGSNDHRFSNLWGGDDKANDDGYLNTTFACCWWDEGCRERMPRIRFGRIHVLNCLYSSSVTSYAIGIGYKARAYVENSVFSFNINSSHNVWKYASTSGQNDHSFIFTNCIGISDVKDKVVEDFFIPSDVYSYQKFSAKQVEEVLTDTETGAGATLDIEEGQPFTSNLTGIDNNEPSVVSTTYYNIAGAKVSPNTKGVLIKTEVMSDNTRKISKITRR